MKANRLTVFGFAATLFMAISGSALAADCKNMSVEGWGVTEDLAKWQSTQMLLFSTGNWIVQNDRFSKPTHSCKLTLLGWTCTATAKICKK